MRNQFPDKAFKTSFWFILSGIILVIGFDRLQVWLAPISVSARYLGLGLELILIFLAAGGIYFSLRRQTQKKEPDSVVDSSAKKSSGTDGKNNRTFYDRLPSGYMCCRLVCENERARDFVFEQVNPAFEKLAGEQNLAGRRASELDQAGSQIFFKLLEVFERVTRSGCPEQTEYHFQKNNRWFALTIYRIDTDHFAAIVEDISSRKRSEQTRREEEVRFQAVFDANACGIVITRQQDGRIVDVNRAFAYFHGHTPDEMIGHTSTELGLWISIEAREELLAILEQQGRCENFEIKSRKKSGEPFNATVWAQKIVLNGEAHLLGIMQLTAGSNSGQPAVVEDEERLRQILNHTRCIINAGLVTGPTDWRERAQQEDWPFVWDYPVLNVDTAQQVMPLDVPAGLTYYQTWKQSRHPLDEAQMHRNSGRAFLENAPYYRNEFRCRDRHGIEHWMQQLVTVRRLAEGRWHLFGVTMDVSELKHAYQALGESEEQFRICIEFLPVPIGIAGDQGKIIYYNKAFTEHYGYVCADTPTISEWAALAYPDPELRKKYQAQWDTDLQQAVEKGTTTPPRLYRVTCKDGRQKHVEIKLRPTGKFFIASFNDLTERIESEIQLRKLSRAVEQCPVSIMITDGQGIIEYANPHFTKVTGYTVAEVIGRKPNFLKSSDSSSELFHQLWQTITAGKDWHGEFHNRKKNGELFWERATISPIFDKASQVTHFLALKEDISTQRQLEQQLRQSQKMEAIGMLAGGVAHDFNNILTVIQGNASLMMQVTLTPEEYLEYATQISAASGRAANLTRQLLMFSRKQVIQPVSLDLNETVSQMAKMLQRILGEDISLMSQLAANLPLIRGDAGMVEQIILNLSVNARDAMPSGGQLTIATSLGHIDENNTIPAVCLSVSDTGCGIPAENLQHVFEPFFTTKENGKGTGLGLATVDSIVQQHQGKITVTSKPGLGSTFVIKFPIATQSPAGSAKSTSSRLPGGTETILVVEDEAPVRVFVSKLLERCGYTIFRAESGIEALTVWQQHKESIDLLLTDIIMPGGLNGYELAACLQEEKPQLKVVYTSGYTGDLTGKRSTLVEGVNFLQKPYPPQRLAEILRQVLDTNKNPPSQD